jgi:hypothetical protein
MREKVGTAFRRAVASLAEDNKIPVVCFGKNDRKVNVLRPYLARQARIEGAGVAAIGVAQEFAPVFATTTRTGQKPAVCLRLPCSSGG